MKRLPLALVIATCIFTAFAYRSELLVRAPEVNDAVFNRLDTLTQARALAHEMGHALGLDHSLECDGGTLMWKDDRCVVFVVSDFLDPGCRQALRMASRRHDVIAVVLEDPREAALPAVGLVELEEAETGERYVVDTGNLRVREAFARQAAVARAERDRGLRAADVDAIVVQTDRPYTEALLRFFRMRERRQ